MKSKNKFKTITLFTAIMLSLGAMIGGEFFSLIGSIIHMSKNYTWLSFLLGGTLALISAYPIVKLTKSHPNITTISLFYSKYFKKRYFKISFNFLILFAYTFSVSLYAKSFGIYLMKLLNVEHSEVIYLGSIIVVMFTLLINYLSIKTITFIENVSVVIKLAIIFTLALLLTYLLPSSQNIVNLLPSSNINVNKVISSAFILFISFEGFEMICSVSKFMSEKNISKAFYLSIIIATTIYIILSLLIVGNLNYALLSNIKEMIFSVILPSRFGKITTNMLVIGICFSIFSELNATFLTINENIKFEEKNKEIKKITYYNKDINLVLVSIIALIISFYFDLIPIASSSSLFFIIIFISLSWLCYIHHHKLNANKYLLILIISLQLIAFSWLLFDTFMTYQLHVTLTTLLLLALPFILSYIEYKLKFIL